MRVLHIDTGLTMRGGQYQTLLLMEALQRNGHGCIFLGRPGGLLARAAHRCGIPAAHAKIFQIWRYSRQVDIVHVHDARAHTLAALASGTKFVVSRRVAFPIQRSWPSRWKYSRATRFLAVSHYVARQLEAAVPGAKIDIVYDAVADGPPAAPWSSDAPAVALASHDPAKGRDLVERASLLSGVPVIYSQDLTNDLPRASLFIYATRSEGLGSAALLAMRMGVPVIASRIGGLIELLEESRSGLLVENAAEAIAAAMQRIRQEPGLANRLIEQGKKRVQTAFTVEHLLQNTLNSYRKALAD